MIIQFTPQFQDVKPPIWQISRGLYYHDGSDYRLWDWSAVALPKHTRLYMWGGDYVLGRRGVWVEIGWTL